jgi:hypothetical protein
MDLLTLDKEKIFFVEELKFINKTIVNNFYHDQMLLNLKELKEFPDQIYDEILKKLGTSFGRIGNTFRTL